MRNSAVDITKFLAALLVVAIHTHPFQELSPELDFFFVQIVCRMAVPFFAVCTGYYLTVAVRSHRAGGGNEYTPLWKSVRKIACLYTGWSVLYLLLHLMDWYTTVDYTTMRLYVTGWCKSFFISSSYYHLWYLSSLFYSMFFFYLVLKYVAEKWYVLLTALFWSLEVVFYAYPFILPPWIVLVTSRLPDAMMTGLIRMLPLLMAGTLIGKYITWPLKRRDIVLTMGAFLLLAGEVYTMRSYGLQHQSFVFSTLPLAFLFFSMVLRIPAHASWDTGKVAGISLFIYCVHPAVLWGLSKSGLDNPLYKFVLSCVASMFLGLVLQKMKRSIRQRSNTYPS